jgi:nicotinate-nucleotide adenylyltransferase
MGSDSFQNIERWKNYQQLLKNYSILIYERPGFEVKNFIHDNVKVVKAPLLEISATHIRKTIQEGLSIRYLVPENVKAEIERNRYYR